VVFIQFWGGADDVIRTVNQLLRLMLR